MTTGRRERGSDLRRGALLAVATLLVTLPLGNVVIGPVQLVQATAALAVGVVTVVAALRLRATLPPWQVGLPLGAMIVSAAIASLGTPVPDVSLRINAMTLVGVLLVVSMWDVVDRASRLMILVRLLVLAGAIVGVVSLIGAGDVSTAAGGAIVRGRAVGIFEQPNELGIFAAMVLPVAVALALARPGRQRWLSAVGALAIAAALVLSVSRGAWIGAAIGLLALMTLLPDRRPVAGLLATAGAVGALFLLWAPPAVVDVVRLRGASILSGEDNPYDERGEAYAEAARQIADSPVAGHGPGAFTMTAQRLTPDGYDLDVLHAHSLLLVIATEYGALGVLALLALVAGLVWMLYRAFWSRRSHRTEDEREVQIVASGLFAGLVAMFAHGLVDYPLRNPVSGATAWILLALTVAAIRCARLPGRDRS